MFYPGIRTNNLPRNPNHLAQNRKQTFEHLKIDSGKKIWDPGAELCDHLKSLVGDLFRVIREEISEISLFSFINSRKSQK